MNFSMKPFGRILVGLVGLCSLNGCEELGTLIKPNKPPAIDRIFALRNQLSPTDTTTVIVEAHDPEDGALSFEWKAEQGVLSSTAGPYVRWTAPSTAGNFKISVEVRDDKRGETQGQITLTVLASEKPTVKIIEPFDGAFIPGFDVFEIKASANHPNGIQRVEFQVGAQYLGSVDTPPYKQTWQVDGLSGPATIIVRAFRARIPGDPGVDSVRVNVEGTTRL
ncbi:MAG: hypothetical protein ALAOOOJD_00350 [bacterium]|nr:hypothetical protein [bacterium]